MTKIKNINGKKVVTVSHKRPIQEINLAVINKMMERLRTLKEETNNRNMILDLEKLNDRAKIYLNTSDGSYGACIFNGIQSIAKQYNKNPSEVHKIFKELP